VCYKGLRGECIAVYCIALNGVGERFGSLIRIQASFRMQYVAVCCSVLQCFAVRCSVLHCIKWCRRALWLTDSYTSVLQDAVCCSVLQCVAVCCSVLQCVAVYCIALNWCRRALWLTDKRPSGCCVLQCVAVRCSSLPCVGLCRRVF